MIINRVIGVCFSPTGGTKKYVAAIAQRLGAAYQLIDLTPPHNRGKEYAFTETDLVIFGAPVYYGRLPQVEGGIFTGLQGRNTPAVFNVTYGNGQYGDALLEEKELLEAQGFVGLAAGAWIAPHSFSEKIAANRPDNGDLEAIADFAKNLLALLNGGLPRGSLDLPGNYPYKTYNALSFYPLGNDKCVDCRTCVKVCPTGAIADSDPTRTDSGKCILCLACVKECPWEAREIADPAFADVCRQLESKLLVAPQKAATFFRGVK